MGMAFRRGVAGLATFGILTFGAMGVMTARPALAAPPPVEAYAMPAASQVELSPNGTHVAYLALVNGVQHLVIQKLETSAGDKPVVIPPGDYQFATIQWANSDTIIFQVIGRDSIFADGPGRRVPVRFSRMGAVERDGKNLRVLYEPKFEPGYAAWTSGGILQFIDHDHVMIVAPDGRSQVIGRLNIYTGKMERLERSRASGLSFMPDPSGKLRLATRFDDRTKTQRFLFRTGLDAEFQEISRISLDDDTELVPLGFGKDDTLYVVSNHESDTSAVYTFDLKAGTFKEKILAEERFDAASPIMRRGEVIGLSYYRDLPVHIFFDPAIQKLQEGLDKAVPDSTEVVMDWTQDGRFTLLLSQGPTTPTAYMVFDRQNKQLVTLADTFPGIPQEAIGRREAVSYKARDGWDIPAYLTLPPGREGGKLPFIVLPHGGPIARDDQSFDTLSQFLASRGYAVLQPNFRGSAGYGTKFMKAGRGEWGGKMQTDVVDGVRWAIEQGVADPDRICIVGWSYGGYSALIGAAQDSGLFKCAIATAPVSNLDRLWKELAWSTDGTEFNRSLFFFGNRDSLQAVSPYHQAKRVEIPVLLIHGDMDVQAFVEHSRDMAAALKDAGKPYEYIEIKGMDHSPQTAEQMIGIFSAWERFLKQHIGN